MNNLEEEEQQIIGWIETTLGISFETRDLSDELKDGAVLCRLLQKVQPGSIEKVNEGGRLLSQVENISSYLKACYMQGIPTFGIQDLLLKRNLPSVLENLKAVQLLMQHNEVITQRSSLGTSSEDVADVELLKSQIEDLLEENEALRKKERKHQIDMEEMDSLLSEKQKEIETLNGKLHVAESKASTAEIPISDEDNKIIWEQIEVIKQLKEKVASWENRYKSLKEKYQDNEITLRRHATVADMQYHGQDKELRKSGSTGKDEMPPLKSNGVISTSGGTEKENNSAPSTPPPQKGSTTPSGTPLSPAQSPSSKRLSITGVNPFKKLKAKFATTKQPSQSSIKVTSASDTKELISAILNQSKPVAWEEVSKVNLR